MTPPPVHGPIWKKNETRLITMRSQPIVLRLFCLVVVVGGGGGVVVVDVVFVVFVVVVVPNFDVVV